MSHCFKVEDSDWGHQSFYPLDDLKNPDRQPSEGPYLKDDTLNLLVRDPRP
jgi:hypothetical protein